MAAGTPAIARIRLARSRPRMLALPLLGLLVGSAAVAGGIYVAFGPMRLMTAGLALAGVGTVVVVLAVATALVLLSIRLEIEEAAVRVRRIGGGREYTLVPGPVTRVRLRGENVSRLRTRARLPGWQLGRARLRDEEDIEIVRLAPTATAILVPTDRGRLAIAARDEPALLDALSHAARARRRLEAAASPTPDAAAAAGARAPEA
jgi:hypothetical protein